MAITNFTELKAAVAGWADTADAATTAYLDDVVMLSTSMLNYGGGGTPAIRTKEMLTTTVIEASYGVADLPADFLEPRYVTALGARRYPLGRINQVGSDEYSTFPSFGTPKNFVILGNQLRVSPYSTSELFVVYYNGSPVYADGALVTTEAPTGGSQIELVYYQAIPNLTISNPTNWLLTKRPDIYLHACLLNLAALRRDQDLQNRSASMLTSLIDGFVGSDFVAQYAGVAPRLPFTP